MEMTFEGILREETKLLKLLRSSYGNPKKYVAHKSQMSMLIAPRPGRQLPNVDFAIFSPMYCIPHDQ